MKRITTILVAMLVAFLMGGSWAWAGEDQTSDDNCVTETTDWVLESPGKGWVQVDQQTVTDKEAYSEQVEVGVQHYSLAGGAWKSNEVPEFPEPQSLPENTGDPKWVANAELEPHLQGNGNPATWIDNTEPLSGQHYTSNENSGNTDWFYLERIYETKNYPTVTHEEYKFSKTTCDEDPRPTTTSLKQQKFNCDGYFMRVVTITTLDGEVIERETSKWVKVGDLTKADKVQLECLTPIDEPKNEPKSPEKASKTPDELPHTGGNLALAGIAAALLAAGSGLVWFGRRRLTDV